ncbi:hypothetical protein [Proteus sp. G2674]|uniref:hypothetical protein n=1 Tax=Proteus sp. G2674 TaxID=2698886 RepID=UPI0019299100
MYEGIKQKTFHRNNFHALCERVDAILAWDKAAVDATTVIKKCLFDVGLSIGNNDSAIAGHAVSVNAILVTNNTREFSRVEGLKIEGWTHV